MLLKAFIAKPFTLEWKIKICVFCWQAVHCSIDPSILGALIQYVVTSITVIIFYIRSYHNYRKMDGSLLKMAHAISTECHPELPPNLIHHSLVSLAWYVHLSPLFTFLFSAICPALPLTHSSKPQCTLHYKGIGSV